MDYLAKKVRLEESKSQFGKQRSLNRKVSKVIQHRKQRPLVPKKECIQFLYIAEGCLFEVLTLTELFKRRKLFKKQKAKEIRLRAEIIDRKMHGLINRLRRRS